MSWTRLVSKLANKINRIQTKGPHPKRKTKAGTTKKKKNNKE